jgi:hypothetical protein
VEPTTFDELRVDGAGASPGGSSGDAMDIQLTEEQRQVDLCREDSRRRTRPNARRWDADHVFPREA